MYVVIIAAGLGKRLRPLTDNKPKAMVEVAGKKLIDYAVAFAQKLAPNRIYIVGGYRFDVLKDYVKANYEGKGIDIIENKEYNEGSILTIDKALSYIDDTFLLMNVDHIYPDVFAKIINSTQGDIVCACDFDRQLGKDDMKIKRQDNRIKAMSKQLSDYDGGYIGMSLIKKGKLDIYKEIAKVIMNKDRSKNVESIINEIAKDYMPYIADCSGYKWYEIDSIDELKLAERDIYKHSGGSDEL